MLMAVPTVEIRPGVSIGAGGPLLWVAGPCVIESRDLTMGVAEAVKKISVELSFPFVFKASFDKANRTSGRAFRGPGIDAGLKVLEEVKRTFAVPVTTDVHDVSQVAAVAGVVDV